MTLASLCKMWQSIEVGETKPLGKGMFGIVYPGVRIATRVRGKDLPEMDVAVKRPPDPLTAHRERAKFLNEIHVMSLTKHAACLRLIAFDTPGNGRYSIVTERMSTGLQAVVDAACKAMAPDGWDATSKSIAALGIAAGMAYLHANHIIHRNLSLSNVLLADDFTPRIGGFGFAKIIPPDRPIHMTLDLGTPLFMAPELHLQEDDYSFPVDVYAYGMMMYAMITELEPFKGLYAFRVAREITDGKRPPFPKGMPAFYRNLIEKCWDANSADRPTFREILADPDEFKLDGCDDNAFEDYKVDVLKLA